MKQLTGILLKVGKEPVIVKIEDTLSAKQALVGGYIECVQLSSRVDLVVDEEGRLKSKEPNIHFADPHRLSIVGDCFIIGVNPKIGKFVSLTEIEQEVYMFRYALKKRLEGIINV